MTVGFLGSLVGLVTLVILFALSRVWTLEVAVIRLAWVPVTALALPGVLWRPMTRALSYASIVPPLLTCIVSFFVGILGATLLAGRPRSDWHPRLLRSTMLTALPGVLLAAYIVVSVVRFFVKN